MSILIKVDDKGNVSFNGDDLLKNPKLFLSDDKRLRTQTNLMIHEQEVPIDIVIHEFALDKPSLLKIIQNNIKINIKISGEELISNIKFNLMITYEMGKEMPYIFHGYCGETKIRQSFENALEIFQYFYKLFS